MAKRKLYDCVILLLSATRLLSVVGGVSACSMIEEILELEEDDDHHGSGRVRNSDNEKPRWDNSVVVPTYDTVEPTGSYTSPTYETYDIDAEFLTDICVYSVWYDAIDDNPLSDTKLNSEDAFALKGVFYFSTPLYVTFEAHLYKDDELIMTREVTLNDEVTAECDFSAGLEGLGTFEPGSYMIVLLYDGEVISTTDSIEVR